MAIYLVVIKTLTNGRKNKMKKLFLIALLSVFAFAGTVQFAHAEQGDLYIGVKAGIVEIDDEDDVDIDAITTMGILAGVGVTEAISIEGELNVSVSGGEIDAPIPVTGGDVNVWSLAAYGVYRHPVSEMISLKAKAGVLFESVEIDVESLAGDFLEEDSDFEVSYGAGATIKLTDELSAEVEYTVMESDVAYISAGVNYKF